MNYYNEHDPKAASWLRVLIAQNQIPKGDVDERDIQKVEAADLVSYDQCHFFAGIGGWSCALRLAGLPDNYPLWTGSCPCQPFSSAGLGMAESDERHLWPDFRNLIGKRKPARVFGEQVASKAGREWLAGVSADMEALGHRFAAADLCAASVGSPHKRQRLFWVADSNERADIPSVTRVNKPSGEDGVQENPVRLANGSGNGRPGSGEERPVEKRLQERLEQTRKLAARPEGRGVACVAMGDTDGSGLQGQRGFVKFDGSEVGETEERHRSTSGFWDESQIIQGADGKFRRIPVEPEFFPLVDGFPARVAVLRGFGNAIVPQVAAQFITAYLEAL